MAACAGGRARHGGRERRRYRDNTPALQARAEKAVAAWRREHPQGTYDQLAADLAPDFPKGYAPVLRSLLFVLERHEARMVTGATITGRGAR